jgi:hypothetical protein
MNRVIAMTNTMPNPPKTFDFFITISSCFIITNPNSLSSRTFLAEQLILIHLTSYVAKIMPRQVSRQPLKSLGFFFLHIKKECGMTISAISNYKM